MTVYPQTPQSYLQQMLSTRSKGGTNLTNFTDDSEKIGKNKNRKKSRNMADAGNKDPQHQEPEEEHQGPQEDETGDEDRAVPTEMYLPDLDTAPLSQALKNGLDWGIEDEVMVECPKLKQYFGVDTFLIQRIYQDESTYTPMTRMRHFPSTAQKPNSQSPYSKKLWREQKNKGQPLRIYQEKIGHGKSRPS